MTNQPLNEVALEAARDAYWKVWVKERDADDGVAAAIQAYLAATNVQKPPENEHSSNLCSNGDDANKRLRDAVIILPDGAEPEVGDLACYNENFGSAHILNAADLRMDYARPFRIIQRQGKPVIYQSALATDKTE